MRKVGIIVIVALLAISGIMAVMAYTSAMVSSPTGLVIVNTDEALLALIPNEGVGYLDETASVNGRLVLNFAAGLDGDDFGFQPNASYTFSDLFFVKNNSNDYIKMGMRFSSVYVDQPWPTGLHTVATAKTIAVPGSFSYTKALMHGFGNTFKSGWNEGRYIILAPGEEVGISWNFSVGSTQAVTGNESWSLQVHAEPIPEP